MKVDPWALQFLLWGKEVGVEFFGGSEYDPFSVPLDLTMAGLQFESAGITGVQPWDLCWNVWAGRDADEGLWECQQAPERGRACHGLDREQFYPKSHLWLQRPSFTGTKRHAILLKLKLNGDIFFYCPKIIKRKQSWDKPINRVMTMGSGPK